MVAEVLIVRMPPGALDAGDPGELLVQAGTGEAGDAREARLGEVVEQAVASGQRLFLVFASADVLMTRVRLTRKQAKQLQRALPYLLEDDLLEPPEQLWYAWTRPAGDHYPVLACDREALTRLRGWCLEQGVDLAGASSDAALLADRAPLRLADEHSVLLLPDERQALTVTPAEEASVRAALAPDEEDWTEITGRAAVLEALARGRARDQYVELLHGEMRPPAVGSDRNWSWRQWRPLAGLAAAVLVLVCALLGVQQWRYEKAAEALRQSSSELYKELFPRDRATARLRAQFRQRLNSLGAGGQAGRGFLDLMAGVGDTLAEYRSQGVTTRRLQYSEREGNLQLELRADGYEAVEAVRKQLAEQGLKAEIATARDDGDGVTARLRVGKG
jgi:general secretion pathway protein L